MTHKSIAILVFTPFHIILMSLELPVHYLLLVKSISNLQAQNLLPVTRKHAGGAVNANSYFRCQSALWLPRETSRTQFGSARKTQHTNLKSLFLLEGLGGSKPRVSPMSYWFTVAKGESFTRRS